MGILEIVVKVLLLVPGPDSSAKIDADRDRPPSAVCKSPCNLVPGGHCTVMFVKQCCGTQSGSFYHHAKIVKKP
jgi:hypothetical protein